jgi:hypothetical protein
VTRELGGTKKMSLEFLLLNKHIAFFFIGVWLGFGLVLCAQFAYIKRSKKMVAFNPFDLLNYSKREKIILFAGIIIFAISLLGLNVITEKYGYNTIVYDIYGNKTIEKIND